MIEPKPSVARLQRLRDIGANRQELHLLDKNERTTPFPEHFTKELFGSITPQDLIKYPDQSDLYNKLSAYLSLSTSKILLVPGSDSGIKIIFDTYARPNDQVVSFKPTYAMVHVYAELFGCISKPIEFNHNLTLSIDELLAEISSSTRLVILANPNQPTGTLLSISDIEQILHITEPNNTLVVVDEAYHEFSGADSTIELIDQYTNLCVLRTFSKAWGLASARVGYIVSNPSIVQQLEKVKPLLDINLLAIKSVCLLLEKPEILESHVLQVRNGMNYLGDNLFKLGIEYYLSRANFVHFRPPNHIRMEELSNILSSEGFRVRTTDNTNTKLDGCIRITVGTPQQIEALINVLSNNIGNYN